MTVRDFECREDELLQIIHDKLKAGIYRFKPARRALIPKEGSSKMRKLGIPVVIDRIVSQSINTVFYEIFDSDFTESNFGFRKEKSQHQAIKYVQNIVKIEGKSFADALSLYPGIFFAIYINMLRADETTSANLEIVLERLADITEKQQALRSQIRSVLLYPEKPGSLGQVRVLRLCLKKRCKSLK